MRNWFLVLILGVLGVVTAVSHRWGFLSHFETIQIKAKPITTTTMEPVIPQRPSLTLDQRMLNSSVRVLQQSHLIFTESWRLLVGVNSLPNSVMKAASVKLSPTDILACPKAHEDVVTDTKNFMITLKHNTCGKFALTTSAEFKWKNFESTQTSAELNATFYPNQLPEGVGDSLALLNRPITCNYQIGGDDKILTMSCQNLGQGVGRAEHYLFSRFEYFAEKKDLLIVEADHYRNLMEKVGCVSDKPCLSLHVPLQGAIHVVENRKTGKTHAQPQMPSATASAMVASLNQAPVVLAPVLPGASMADPNMVAPDQAFDQPMAKSAAVSKANGDFFADQNAAPITDENGNPVKAFPVPGVDVNSPDNVALSSAASEGIPNGAVAEGDPNGKNKVQDQDQDNSQNQSIEKLAVQGEVSASAASESVRQDGSRPESGQQSLQQSIDADPALQGLPSENSNGPVSPELQPAQHAVDTADLQSREPTGQENSPVFLPQR